MNTERTRQNSSRDTCSRCGRPRSEWRENFGQGYMKDELLYCCPECAAGGKCLADPFASTSPVETGTSEDNK